MSTGAPDRIFILIKAPNGDTREVPVGDVRIVVGRDESADIRVEDRRVSRRHAAFVVEDGAIFVEDLGSANGVKLNGRRVERRAPFAGDDVVFVGGYEVRVKAGQGLIARPSRPIEPARTAGDRPPDPREVSDTVGLSAKQVGQVRERSKSGVKGTPVLVGLVDPVMGQRFTLELGENIVGRLEDCQVSVLDGSLSRQHGRVEVHRDKVRVVDLESSNGVFVNETKVKEARLNNGDSVRFGNVAFRVEMPPALSTRIGPVAGARAEATSSRRPPSHRPAGRGRGRVIMVSGTLVLLAAIVVFAVEARRAGYLDRLPGAGFLASVGFDAQTGEARPDGGVDVMPPVSLPDASSDGVAVTEPDAGAAVATKDAGAVVVAVGDPSVPVARTVTATSPFGRKDERGWPVRLPVVDASFDFDGFVSGRLSEARAFEEAGRYEEVRQTLKILAERDPINADARSMLDRVEQGEAAKRLLERAAEQRRQGRLMEALGSLAAVDERAPQYSEARAQLASLQPVAFAKELERAARESEDKSTWKAAHARLVSVLEVDPTHAPAVAAITELEKKMVDRRVRFRAYVPPADRAARPTKRDPRQAIASSYEDRVLRRIVERYASGAIDEAIKSANSVAKKSKGERKTQAKKIGKGLEGIRAKYKRVKTALGNDPGEAWAHLIELEKLEARILPEGVRSELVEDLRRSIAAEYAGRGDGAFQQGRHEDAFQQWKSALTLDARNAAALSGLERLEKIAETEAREIELAAQMGAKDVCDRWRRLTRMTRVDSEVYKSASQRVKVSCSKP